MFGRCTHTQTHRVGEMMKQGQEAEEKNKVRREHKVKCKRTAKMNRGKEVRCIVPGSEY